MLNIKIKYLDSLAGSTKRRCPNTEKVRDIGFEPSTTLDLGLEKTVDFYLNYKQSQTIDAIIR